MADTESRIWAFDVANASQPRLIGETQKQLETPGAISVFSNLVVATAGVEGIEVLRFDGLESTVLSHMDTPGSALGVALKGPIAYVADSDALLIVDLTDPSLPRLLKRLPIPASAVAVEGDRLFAAGASLHVLDIADAQNPIQTAELPLPSAIEKIIPRDQVLFLGSARESYIIGLEPATRILSQVVGKQIAATDENLITVSNTTHVYDLSDLTAPTEVGAPRSFPTIWDYALKDGIVLAARGTNFVEIVDVRDPLAPRSLGTLRTAARALGIDLVGNVAAIACDIAGVELWDVTEAKAPLLLSNPRMGNELVNPTHRISNTALTTNRLYALSPRRIFLFDITDATQPIYKSTYILPTDLSDILVRGTEIFCTTSDGIVRILDASNPSNIQQVGIYSGIRDYGGLSGIKGNFLYGNASGGVGQYILDISAPATPRLVVSRYGPTGGTLLEDLLVAGTSGRNVIFDASTPVQPAPVGRFSEDVSTGNFQKSGAWHYTVENALGASTRISIYKTANSAPLIHSHPGDVTVRYFENAYSISGGRLSIEVTGALPMDYQWYRGKRGDLSDPLPGATNNFYFFDPSGDLRQPVEKFWVRVANKIGHANSRTATIYSVPYLQMRASGELRISSLPNSKWTLGSSSNLMNWTPERIIAIPEAPGSASSTVDITLNDRAEGTRFYRLQFIPEE